MQTILSCGTPLLWHRSALAVYPILLEAVTLGADGYADEEVAVQVDQMCCPVFRHQVENKIWAVAISCS